jgi:hypothetical protein
MFAPDGRPRIDRQMVADKADELDRTISKLTSMREGLRHAAVCPAPPDLPSSPARRRIRRHRKAKYSGCPG